MTHAGKPHKSTVCFLSSSMIFIVGAAAKAGFMFWGRVTNEDLHEVTEEKQLMT